MKSVNVNTKSVNITPITPEKFAELSQANGLYFGIVKDEKDRATHVGKSQWSLMGFESACKIAKGHNQLVVSDHFWIEPNVGGFLIFIPQTSEYKLRVEKKAKKPVMVSDKVYQQCVSEVEDQKKRDQMYKCNAPSNDYYSLDNWTFNIKDGQIMY